MQLIDLEKEKSETSGLRLVSDNREPQRFPIIEKQFVNFMFLRINPDWRKLDAKQSVFSKLNFKLSLINSTKIFFYLVTHSSDSIQRQI